MARPKIEGTNYKVSIHKNQGYSYASTQPLLVDDNGKTYNKRIHWGTVDENLRFHPNSRYLLASAEERDNLVFPADWDMSEAEKAVLPPDRGRQESSETEENRLYGDIWLLEQIDKESHVREDLMEALGCKKKVDDILTLAMFFVTTGHTSNRVERWQRIEKSPSAQPLTSVEITRLMQSITEADRIKFLSLRRKRMREGELCAVDTTSRSAYGDTLADIRWGKNKEGLALPQTNEMVVYGLESHMPFYYRQFPGNMPDSRTVDCMLADLSDAGFGKIPIISDRGFESTANLELLIMRGQPFVSATKVSNNIVYKKILEIGDISGVPSNMTLCATERIYHRSFDIDYPVTSTNGRRVNSYNLRLHLFFNPTFHAEHLMEVEIAVAAQTDHLKQLKDKGITINDQTNEKRQNNFFKITFDENGRISDYVKDIVKIEKSKRMAGFFAIMTHVLDYDALQAKEAYAMRDEQEKYYEQSKSMLRQNRQRNWSEDGKAGSLFISFVGLILSSRLRHVWKSTILKEEFSSTYDILDEMRSIHCVEHPGHHPKITPFVGKQRVICEAFGFEPPAGCGVGYKSRKVSDKKRGRPAKPKNINLE